MAMEITEADFEEWREQYLTKQVLSALMKHASAMKIDLLGSIWDCEDPEVSNELIRQKDMLRIRTDLIKDIGEMNYDEFVSYFKSE